MPRLLVTLAVLLATTACSRSSVVDVGDAGGKDGGGERADGGPVDAGERDAGETMDAGAFDGGAGDSGPSDSGAPDSGPGDAGPPYALGTPCASADACKSGTCDKVGWDFVAPSICTADCNAAETACPESGHCLVPGAFAGWCVATCASDADCHPDLTCVDDWDGTGGCVPRAYDCDPKVVTCKMQTPICKGLEVPVVSGTCWTGACVAYDRCRPIPCDPAGGASECPMSLVCYSNTRTCGPPL